MAFINGSGASESLVGSGENDTLMGNDGADTLNGGDGWNVVAYWSSPTGIGVQLGRGLTSDDGFGAPDVLINIHGVFGSNYDDILLGSDLTDFLVGGEGGNDTIRGMAGGDALYGYAGNDVIAGGEGEDTAYFRGFRENYTVTAIEGGFNIIDNRGIDGADVVTEVEFFRFEGDDAVGENDMILTAAEVLIPFASRATPADDALIGTNRNDRIDALAGNDTVRGNGGDDTLIGGAGNDALDGGAGYDTAAMGDVGFRGVGTLWAGGNLTVTSTAGTDTLVNMEVVTFADGRLVMDINDPAARVARLYEAALDRLPDQGGLNYWIDALQDGLSLNVLAGAFAESAEFRSRFGGAAAGNGAFVDQLYLNVLGRAGEPGGRDYWVDILNRGAASRAEVLVGFSESGENKAGTEALVRAGIWDRSEAATEVARLYDTVLGRLPDASGLVAWKSALESGGATLLQVADAFTQSAEFRSRYGSLDNRAFADALYVNTLDRPADGGGLDYWTRMLNEGHVRRAEVVLAFSESAEHVALTASRIQSETPGEYGTLFA